jgi:hypothetical protein
MEKQDLAERIRRLEEEKAIYALVYRYAALCDDRYNPDALAALFTEDASWSSASADGKVDFGRPRGREAIREHFASLQKKIGVPTFHGIMAPEVSLACDGNTASGRWYTVVLLTMLGDGSRPHELVMLGATYDHDYRKVGAEWLFSRLDAQLHFYLPVGRI